MTQRWLTPVLRKGRLPAWFPRPVLWPDPELVQARIDRDRGFRELQRVFDLLFLESTIDQWFKSYPPEGQP